MKLVLLATAITLAAPALSQTAMQPAGVAFGQPTCSFDGSCSRLSAVVRSQLGAAAAPAAMGGPYEPVTQTIAPTMRSGDYPPCPRRDRTADRCIQLYERGVTGK